MNENIKQLHNKVKELCAGLQPEQFKVHETLKVKEHYTFVCLADDTLLEKIAQSVDVNQFSSELHFNKAEKYHLTLFFCDISYDVERVIGELRKIIKETEALSFSCNGIFAASEAVVVAAFADNAAYNQITEHIHKSVGVPEEVGFRKALRWISLARYKVAPRTEMREYFNSLSELDLGVFRPKEIIVYKTKDRVIEDAVEITRIAL